MQAHLSLLLLAWAMGLIPIISGSNNIYTQDTSTPLSDSLYHDGRKTKQFNMNEPLPEWAQPKNNSEWLREWNRNLAAIAAANESGQRLDLVMYGDSITAWHKPLNLKKINGTREVWNRAFSGLLTEPLGIPGDRVSFVTWRIAAGGERPILDPRIVVIFVGINDGLKKTPDVGAQMDYLLGYVSTAMPQSTVVVQALLPSHRSGEVLNETFRVLAEQHGALFSRCGQYIPRNDRRYMVDLLHPNKAGHGRILKCLRKLVDPIIAAKTF